MTDDLVTPDGELTTDPIEFGKSWLVYENNTDEVIVTGRIRNPTD